MKEIPQEKPILRSEILHNLGTLEALGFRFALAADYYYEAYLLNRDQESLVSFLLAKRLGGSEKEFLSLAEDERFAGALLSAEERLNAANEAWLQADSRRRLDRLSEMKLSRDSIQYYEELSRLVEGLKEQYRIAES